MTYTLRDLTEKKEQLEQQRIANETWDTMIKAAIERNTIGSKVITAGGEVQVRGLSASFSTPVMKTY